MKTCLKILAAYIIIGLVLALSFFLWYPESSPNTSPRLPPAPLRLQIALGAGFIVAIPAFFAYMSILSVGIRLKDRSQLCASAAGVLPAGGERGAFFGRIVREGPPLVAPLSRRDCLLYHYKISHTSRSSGSSSQVTDAEGFALTPSMIQTAAGPVRLLAYVDLEFQPELLEDAVARERARSYLAAAPLDSRSGIADSYKAWKAIMADDDGTIRFDRGRKEADQSGRSFEEQIVQHGDEVCVFGTYSAERRGIVPDPESPLFKPARLRKGSLERLLRGLAFGVFGYVIGLMIFGGVAAAGVWAFFRFTPSMFW